MELQVAVREEPLQAVQVFAAKDHRERLDWEEIAAARGLPAPVLLVPAAPGD